MHYEYKEPAVGGQFLMAVEHPSFERYFFRERDQKLLAIVWNRGLAQTITVDESAYHFPENAFLSLNVSHSFRLERPTDAVVWQFNREFYCIVDHDQEVSCAGLLFYGWRGVEPIFPAEADTRQFNMLVENNYKNLHQVQDYARLMFKSPKTLSNLFARYGQKSPLQIISERILLEGKRQLMYTDRPNSEIAFDLGFEEPAHFSRFFKKMEGQSPSDFKKHLKA